MTSQEITLVPAQQAKVSCSCGCASCTGTCCRLDCLERPRFYCGQLLTDGDLTGLVDWTLDKVRLGRFRHGWGVVCGLDVRCDPDPKRHAHVIVTPGYAVSCCGDDIVVCKETSFDLSDACRKQMDRCSELRRPNSPGNDHMIPVDLIIHYEEQLKDPQAAFGRSACREVSVCEPGRTREGFRLDWRFGMADPIGEVAARWLEQYENCNNVFDEYKSSFPPQSGRNQQQELPAQDIQRWFLRWISKHPLHHFCFIRDRICSTDANEFNEIKTINEILFFLIQDCRNAFLQCACFECSAENAGVRLARIYLRPETHSGKTCCRVQAIDPYPPHRRPLSLSCWPAPSGSVNLGGAIWLPEAEAQTYLRGIDIRVQAKRVLLKPENIDALSKAEVVFEAGSAVNMLLLEDEELEGTFKGRVVGFNKVTRS